MVVFHPTGVLFLEDQDTLPTAEPNNSILSLRKNVLCGLGEAL